MTRRSVQRKPPITSATAPPTVPADLTDLTIRVESTCGLAVGAIRAAARLVIGGPVSLRNDDDAEGLASLCSAGLESLADDLEELASKALKTRTVGGAS
jgi:hypothetical protein